MLPHSINLLGIGILFLILFTYIYHSKTKAKLYRLIRLLKDETNVNKMNSNEKELNKIVNNKVKYFILWKIWPLVIHDLKEYISQEPNPTKRFWVVTALADIGGKNSISILNDHKIIEEDSYVKIGIDDALENIRKKQRSKSLVDFLANIAQMASFIGWIFGPILMYIGIDQHEIISIIIGVIIFIVLTVMKLKNNNNGI